MSEKEKENIEVIAAAIPNMTEFQKGYLIGTAEAMVEKHKEKSQKEETTVSV